MRRPILAGNWKMNNTRAESVALAGALRPVAEARLDVGDVVCPPFTALAEVSNAVAGSRVGVGAQDMFWNDSGAYTGEISPLMLLDAGCRYVILGHSERRGRFGVPEAGASVEAFAILAETDAAVKLKTRAALTHGLTPIICCGETLAERREGQTDTVVAG